MKVLKKYANRKIYDSSERRYVTISDIAEMVKKFEPLQVVDSKSGEDITRSILLQIIGDLEDSAQSTLLTNFLLENIVRMYDDPMGGMLANYLDNSLKSFVEQQAKFRSQFDHQIAAGQEDVMKNFNEQYQDYLKTLYPYPPTK